MVRLKGKSVLSSDQYNLQRIVVASVRHFPVSDISHGITLFFPLYIGQASMPARAGTRSMVKYKDLLKKDTNTLMKN